MASNTFNTSTDETHASTSANATLGRMPARDEFDRLFALYKALKDSTPDKPSGNVIPLPLLDALKDRLEGAWEAGKSEELGEIAAGRLPLDGRVLGGGNPWWLDDPEWFGPPLKIQHGEPSPPLDR